MTIIPELRVRARDAAKAMLCGQFGFAPGPDGRLSLGTQTIALVEGGAAGHGRIDHLALATDDLDRDAAAFLSRGATLDSDVTPDGPLSIPEFWGGGVRYLFFRGPEGARIELIQNLAAPRPLGHDHIGIPCTDIAASVAFATALGARLLAANTLHRPEGSTEVRFLALGTSVLEFYQPPAPGPAATPGLWSRLLIPGAAAQTGPDGLSIGPA